MKPVQTVQSGESGHGPKKPTDDSNTEHPQEVPGELLEARGDTASFLEPSHTTLYHVAATVRDAVESPTPRLINAGRDHCADVVPMQPAANRGIAVTFVAAKPPGAPKLMPSCDGNSNLVHGPLEPLALMALARTDCDGERHSLAVTYDVDLGSEATP